MFHDPLGSVPLQLRAASAASLMHDNVQPAQLPNMASAWASLMFMAESWKQDEPKSKRRPSRNPDSQRKALTEHLIGPLIWGSRGESAAAFLQIPRFPLLSRRAGL